VLHKVNNELFVFNSTIKMHALSTVQYSQNGEERFCIICV